MQICAEAGVRSIEHGNLIDEETARFMAMRGTFLVPTLVTYERLHTEGPSHGIGPDRLHKLGAVLDAGLESLEMAQRSGVKIGSGSDLFGPMRRYQGDEVALQAQALGAMGAIIAVHQDQRRASPPRRRDRDARAGEAGRPRRGGR